MAVFLKWLYVCIAVTYCVTVSRYINCFEEKYRSMSQGDFALLCGCSIVFTRFYWGVDIPDYKQVTLFLLCFMSWLDGPVKSHGAVGKAAPPPPRLP